MKGNLPNISNWFLLFILSFLYFFLAKAGMAVFSLKPSNLTILWLPAGIGLVMFLHWGFSALPFVFLASLFANWDGMLKTDIYSTILHTSISAGADAIAPGLAMLAMKKFLAKGLERARDLIIFGLFVCFLPVSLSSLIITVNLVEGNYISQNEFWSFFRMLVLADSLGIILVYQIYAGFLQKRKMNKREWIWFVSMGVIIFTLIFIATNSSPWALYLIVPCLVVLAFEVSLLTAGAMSTISLISIIIITTRTKGPFYSDHTVDTNSELIAFTFSSAITVLGIALQNYQLYITENDRNQWQTEAEHDPLTGLVNRRAFVPSLHFAFNHSIRSGRNFSLAVIDIDHFKKINDNYGHSTGDLVIKHLANLMNESGRDVDVHSRIGGEEFGIIFPDCDMEMASAWMERLRIKFSENFLFDSQNNTIKTTISIGISCFQKKDKNAWEIFEKADKALYMAKAEGRNRVKVYLED